MKGIKRLLIGIGWFLLAYLSFAMIGGIIAFVFRIDLRHPVMPSNQWMSLIDILGVGYIYLFYRVRTYVRRTRRQFRDLPIVEPSINDVADIEEFYDKKRDLAYAKKLRRGGLI
jgi:hypothetical protein